MYPLIIDKTQNKIIKHFMTVVNAVYRLFMMIDVLLTKNYHSLLKLENIQ